MLEVFEANVLWMEAWETLQAANYCWHIFLQEASGYQFTYDESIHLWRNLGGTPAFERTHTLQS